MTDNPSPTEEYEPLFVREEFALRHGIAPDQEPIKTVTRIIADTAGGDVDINRLTAVHAASLCELLGITKQTWNGWRNHGYSVGRPPNPRWGYAGEERQGVLLWCFEVDIMPWLMQTAVGRAAVLEMVRDIQRRLVYPIYSYRPHKLLVGFSDRPGGDPVVFTPAGEAAVAS